MEKLKRYTVTLDAYLYAENDNEAKENAKMLIELINKIDDSRAQVLKLEETPFGKLIFREVK